MELRQLEMLRAVVEAGGYAGAGARLHISHPAVHRQIRLLEEEIGQRVFQRAGRSVQLTEAGKRLLALSDRVREEIGQTLTLIHDIAEMESGALRIGTATTVLMFFLRRVLHRFSREFPKVALHVATARVADICADIRDGDLDVGIIFAPPEFRAERGQVREQLLYEEEFVLAVGAGHALKARKMISPKHLQDLRFIDYSRQSTLRRYLDARFEAAGIERHTIMELENEETIVRMLETEPAVAILSRRRVLADNLRHFRIRGLPLYCPVCAVSSRNGYPSRAAREFSRICRQECLRNGASPADDSVEPLA